MDEYNDFFYIYTHSTWIYAVSHDCPASWPRCPFVWPSYMAKTWTMDIFTQTLRPCSAIPAMLIGNIWTSALRPHWILQVQYRNFFFIIKSCIFCTHQHWQTCPGRPLPDWRRCHRPPCHEQSAESWHDLTPCWPDPSPDQSVNQSVNMSVNHNVCVLHGAAHASTDKKRHGVHVLSCVSKHQHWNITVQTKVQNSLH